VRLRSVFGLEGQLWVSSNSGLFRSGDAGTSFERIAAVSSAAALGFGQAAPGGSFPAVFLSGNVDGRSGLFRSDDAGGTWQAIDDEMHKFGFINYLTGDPRQFGRVYLGTGGRGIVAGDPR
jgi:xyloglucan-specific exo-beta-1,4-glucanase